jgi:hypothetical protein
MESKYEIEIMAQIYRIKIVARNCNPYYGIEIIAHRIKIISENIKSELWLRVIESKKYKI